MPDNFDSFKANLSSPVQSAVAVTPNDNADLATVSRALYIGGAGNLAVILADDSSSVTFTGVLAGSILPIRAKRVLSTNTTATTILALS